MQADETVMNSANTCLSTVCAFMLSAEYCISSYKHLLWRVQGPLFSEHLFSQMILLLSPAPSHQSRVRVRPPPLHLTAVFFLTCFNALACLEMYRSDMLLFFLGNAVQTMCECGHPPTPRPLKNYKEKERKKKSWSFSVDNLSVSVVTVPRVTLTGIWSIFSAS